MSSEAVNRVFKDSLHEIALTAFKWPFFTNRRRTCPPFSMLINAVLPSLLPVAKQFSLPT